VTQNPDDKAAKARLRLLFLRERNFIGSIVNYAANHLEHDGLVRATRVVGKLVFDNIGARATECYRLSTSACCGIGSAFGSKRFLE
jgi:hypothetical protein